MMISKGRILVWVAFIVGVIGEAWILGQRGPAYGLLTGTASLILLIGCHELVNYFGDEVEEILFSRK